VDDRPKTNQVILLDMDILRKKQALEEYGKGRKLKP
jgi:hypothetical protein